MWGFLWLGKLASRDLDSAKKNLKQVEVYRRKKNSAMSPQWVVDKPR